MKIILLSGKANVGKTSTMIQLYDELKRRDEKMKVLKGAGPKPSAKKTRKLEDFDCLVVYKGKKVALHSPGDLYHDVTDTIVKFVDIADILIVAYRTAFREHPLDETVKKSFGSNRVFYKEKASQKPFDECDCKKAQEIADYLDSICGGMKNA